MATRGCSVAAPCHERATVVRGQRHGPADDALPHRGERHVTLSQRRLLLCNIRSFSRGQGLHLSHLRSCILHLTSYILHLTSYLLHLTSYILHLTSYFLHLTSYILPLTSYILHLTSYIILHLHLHLTSYFLPLTSYCSRLPTAAVVPRSALLLNYLLVRGAVPATLEEIGRGFELGFRQLRRQGSGADAASNAAGSSGAGSAQLHARQEALLLAVLRLLRAAAGVMRAARATAIGIGALVLLGTCFD